jgi:hypothetical protein
VLAKVRCPEAAPVPHVDRKCASKGAVPEGGEAGPSGEGAAEAGEQLEQARSVDGGAEAAVDDLVAALQDYFSKRTRCVGQRVSRGAGICGKGAEVRDSVAKEHSCGNLLCESLRERGRCAQRHEKLHVEGERWRMRHGFMGG